MAGEFHVTGYAAQRVATDAGPELASALDGATGVFTSNIPAGKPIPTGGGILFVPPRNFIIGTDGLFYELLDDGSTSTSPGINLTADDPAFELADPLQWQVTINKYSIGGNLTDIASWWFDAPDPGWSGTIDELAPVPGVDQPGGTVGRRGYTAKWVVVDAGPPIVWQQYIEETNTYIGDPTTDLIGGRASAIAYAMTFGA